YIPAAFAGSLRFDSGLPGHRLCLVLDIRIESTYLGCSPCSHVNRRDGAVGIVIEPLHGYRTGKAAAAGQGAIVIEEVRITGEVDDAGVVREAVALRRHDDPAVSPGARGAGAGRVGDVLGDRAAREHHV